MVTRHFMYEQQDASSPDDVDDPTIPELPAYLLEPPARVALTTSEMPTGTFAWIVGQFNRLSLGARIVVVACALLLAVCLACPFVENALDSFGAMATSAAAVATPTPVTVTSGGTGKQHTAGTTPVPRADPTHRADPRATPRAPGGPTPPTRPSPQPLGLTITCATIAPDSGTATLCVNTAPGATVAATLASCPSGPRKHAASTTLYVSGSANAAGNYTWSGQLDAPGAKCHGAATATVTVRRGNTSATTSATFTRTKH